MSYDRATGKRELHYVAGADHAESILVAPEEYREVVEGFLGHLEATDLEGSTK